MAGSARSTRGKIPEKFEAHVDDSPHDLMINRKLKSDIKLGKYTEKKDQQKKVSRDNHKLGESADEKEIKKIKETLRKRLWRQKNKEKEISVQEKEKKKQDERDRKQIYRALKPVETSVEKKVKESERKRKWRLEKRDEEDNSAKVESDRLKERDRKRVYRAKKWMHS